MAVHTGITTGDGSKLGLLPTSVFVDDIAIDISPFTTWLNEYTKSGVKADGAAPVPVDNKAGISSLDYADLWYNHIHILPNRINVGNLTSQQVRPIEIFNAYFEERTLNSVVANDVSGVDFDAGAPVTIAPLASIFRNLVINTSGSPQFNGFFTLNFDDVQGDYFLYVSGRRVLVMPFQHNWSDKIIERLAWYNTGTKTLSGIQQLVMWRKYPRRTLDYNFLLASTNTNAARLRGLFAALIQGWQARVYAVPIWTDATRLPETAVAGQNVISVPTTFFDYDAGSYIMLWQSEEKYELLEIDTVHADYVTTKVNLVDTWAKAKTVVMPARLGYITPNVQGEKHTVDIDAVPATFELLPQYPSLNRVVNAATVTYRGYPVLLTKNNYNPTNSFAIERRVNRADADIGIFSVEGVQPAPDGSSSFAFIFANHAQIAAYYGWLDNRKGRIGVFWQPTWSHDMQVVQDVASGANGLLIKAIGYSSLYYVDNAPAYNRRDVMIRLKNGTRFFRRITGAGLNEDGTETINLNAALGQNVLTSQIDRVCFLIPSCLKADAIELSWESGNVAQSQLMVSDVYDPNV